MINFEKYCSQLAHIYRKGIIQENPLCQQVIYDSSNHSLLVETKIPSKADTELVLDHLEFKITYSHIYLEPLLLLRIWKQDQDDQYTTIKIWFPPNIKDILKIDDNRFQLGLDTISLNADQERELWYSFHPCDTSQMIGDKMEYIDKYLERWLSVFLYSLLC